MSRIWYEKPTETLSPYDEAMAWCAEREHTDRVECKAIGLDYDHYMQEVARAVMDDGTRPSPAAVQARLDIQQPAESIGYKQALAEGESFMQSLAQHPGAPQPDTPASPLDDPHMPKTTQPHGEPRGSEVHRTGFRVVREPGSEWFNGSNDIQQQILSHQETLRVMQAPEPTVEPRGSAVQQIGLEDEGQQALQLTSTDDTEKIVLEFAPYKLDVNDGDTIEAVSMCQEIGKSEKWMMQHLFKDVSKGGSANYKEFKKIVNYCSLL